MQLLEDGKFTDSLGNEFDLNQYVIFFTSNVPQKEIGNFFSPELMSRFNYKVHFTLLSTEEKNRYVQFKITQVIQKLETMYPSIVDEIDSKTLVEIDVKKYNNLREINNEIMKQISNNLYEKMLSMKQHSAIFDSHTLLKLSLWSVFKFVIVCFSRVYYYFVKGHFWSYTVGSHVVTTSADGLCEWSFSSIFLTFFNYVRTAHNPKVVI